MYTETVDCGMGSYSFNTCSLVVSFGYNIAEVATSICIIYLIYKCLCRFLEDILDLLTLLIRITVLICIMVGSEYCITITWWSTRSK